MALVESVFDISYLNVVLALGIRLLVENPKETKLFGIMAIVLGLGDSFHLLPRVISHLSPGGFPAHVFALSWGKFVTSMTMTIFYVLFYYFYRSQSQDRCNTKRNLIYLLAIVLWADAVLVVGALMMPKTVAYLMIVVLGYKYFIPTFSAKNVLGFSYTFVVMRLFVGVFYREFTKFYGFTAETHLGKLHVHTLVLGFVLTLILYLLTKKGIYIMRTIQF